LLGLRGEDASDHLDDTIRLGEKGIVIRGRGQVDHGQSKRMERTEHSKDASPVSDNPFKHVGVL
jgi:hypothetical protein